MKNRKYCVYAFLDQNLVPFYVGQTCSFKKRRQSHLMQINKKTPKYEGHKKVKELIRLGFPFVMDIIYENLTKEESDSKEIFLIKKYIKKGYKLTNLTSGGKNFTHNEKTKEKISKNNSRHWLGIKKSEETKRRISESKKEYFKTHPGTRTGSKVSKASRKKMSLARIGKKMSQEYKDNLRIIRNQIKPYYTDFWKIVDPIGNVYFAWGLGSFCRKFSLEQAHMFSVSKGERIHHKLWSCKKVKNLPHKKKVIKQGFVLFKKGDIKNINKVLKGKKISYKNTKNFAKEIFKDKKEMENWFSKNNIHLEGKAPNDCLAEKPEKIMEILLKIKYGVYS